MTEIRDAVATSEEMHAGSPRFGAHADPGAGDAPAHRTLPDGFVALHQRSRIVAALAEEVVEHGYREATVAGIVRRAGVARNTFYENFANKEECFLAAADAIGERALRHIVGAVCAAPAAWPERVRAGIGALLGFAASESAAARVFLVESLSAGPAAAERYERTVRAAVPMFRRGRRRSAGGERLPATLEETVVGGIFWVVYQRIVLGRQEELEGLLEDLVEFALTPYIGPAAARRVALE